MIKDEEMITSFIGELLDWLLRKKKKETLEKFLTKLEFICSIYRKGMEEL